MAAVTNQPLNLKPISVGSLPSGLAYLTQIDQIIIKQKVELLEVLTGCETRNRYEILNSLNQQVFHVQEESGCCMRYWAGPYRGFVIHITDNDGQEVITVTHEFKCCVGCCWCADGCCGYLLKIEAPPGNVVGYCTQRNSGCALHMDLLDADMQPLFKIWGPCCPCQCLCCPTDINFPAAQTDTVDKAEALHFQNILNPNLCRKAQSIRVKDVKNPDKVHANIAKMWAGALREVFTDADTFGVTFPLEMDVKQKATIIGAVFMVEFLVFETQKNNNK